MDNFKSREIHHNQDIMRFNMSINYQRKKYKHNMLQIGRELEGYYVQKKNIEENIMGAKERLDKAQGKIETSYKRHQLSYLVAKREFEKSSDKRKRRTCKGLKKVYEEEFRDDNLAGDEDIVEVLAPLFDTQKGKSQQAQLF